MMKFNKKLCAFSVAAVMSLSVCAPALAAEGENAVDLQYNGVTTEDAAVLVNDTTYMSAEDVKAVLGVDCAVADGKAQLTVGSEAVEVETVDGLIPVRAIANALGYSIGWDSEAKTAIVIDVGSDCIAPGTADIPVRFGLIGRGAILSRVHTPLGLTGCGIGHGNSGRDTNHFIFSVVVQIGHNRRTIIGFIRVFCVGCSRIQIFCLC